MKIKDENLLPEMEGFQVALFDAFESLIPLEDHMEDLRKVTVNHLLNLDGPTVVKGSLTPKEKFLQRMSFGCSEISSSYSRLLDLEVYIGKFPFRNSRVSRVRYLRFIVEAFFNEVYLFKERLVTYLRFISRAYRKSSQLEKLRVEMRLLSTAIEKSFERVLQVRGFHVHQYRFSDKNLDRLESHELIYQLSKHHKLKPILKEFYDNDFRATRSQWKAYIKDRNGEVEETVEVYFKFLRTHNPFAGQFQETYLSRWLVNAHFHWMYK